MQAGGSDAKECTKCGAPFEGPAERCPLDGGELVSRPDPFIGRTIGGRYVIRAKIGEGGMGTVYRAEQEVLGRDVAIKFLSRALARKEANRARFLREARAANRINHEHIIDVTDFGSTEDEDVYLVMTYLEGRSLAAEVERGPLDLVRALDIAAQTARGLARAHDLDVVHRDIKPENVHLLRTDDGRDFVKILDFGVAHMKDDLGISSQGSVFGTPEYVSPEQARGAPASPAADLYSYGCTLFEILTGRPPYEGTTSAVILKHASETPPPPSRFRSDVPADVDALVAELLAKRPEDRPPTAHHVVETLADILGPAFRTSVPVPSPAGARSDATEDQQRAVAETLSAPPLSGPPASDADAPPAGDSAQPSGEAGRDEASFEKWWTERVATLRHLLHRAYPDGGAPSGVETHMAELEQHLERVHQLRRARSEQASEAARQEEQTRAARMRIGRALDELGRDEAQVQEQFQRKQRELAEAEERERAAAAELPEAYRGLPSALSAGGSELDPRALEELAHAGDLAQQWMQARQVIRERETECRRLQDRHEDLAFQMAQLKGRLASFSAASDVDIDAVKARAVDRDRELRDELAKLLHKAEPVTQHLCEFPEVREELMRPSGGSLAN